MASAVYCSRGIPSERSGPVTFDREPAFDDVGRAQMFPVLSQEVVERRAARRRSLIETLDRLVVFSAPDLHQRVNAASTSYLVSAIQISCRTRFAFDCLAVRRLCSARRRSPAPNSCADHRSSASRFFDRLRGAGRAIDDQPARAESLDHIAGDRAKELLPGLRTFPRTVDQTEPGSFLPSGRKHDDDQPGACTAAPWAWPEHGCRRPRSARRAWLRDRACSSVVPSSPDQASLSRPDGRGRTARQRPCRAVRSAPPRRSQIESTLEIILSGSTLRGYSTSRRRAADRRSGERSRSPA